MVRGPVPLGYSADNARVLAHPDWVPSYKPMKPMSNFDLRSLESNGETLDVCCVFVEGNRCSGTDVDVF